MCTIGLVYRKSTMIIFKQCDLDKRTLFYEPKIKKLNDIKYMSFEREGIDGPWCGINNYGVGFVVSHSYVKDENNYFHNSVSEAKDSSVFKAYEDIISKYKTAGDALKYMKDFYFHSLSSEILIISDKKESYYVETYMGEVISVKFTPEFDPKYFIATNHFRFLHEGVDFNENRSTYLRLKRGEEMLLKDCSISGVKKLLEDEYYGKTPLSICRSSDICIKGEDLCNTQASAIFIVNNNCSDISTYYKINGNPKNNKFTFKNRIFY